MAYRRQVKKLFTHGVPAEKKKLLRIWIAEIKLTPERREVEIAYRVPEPIVNGVVVSA